MDSSDSPNSRAQTATDLVVGLSLFLILVGVLFATSGVPVTGVAGSQIEQTSESSQIALYLVDAEWQAPQATATPRQLNHTAVTAFFRSGTVTGLPINQTEYAVQVTLNHTDTGPTPGAITTVAGESATNMTAGPPPTAAASDASVVATLDGQTVRVTVEVWPDVS